MRHEVKRFVYMCDGMEDVHKRCKSTQVIDAVTDKEADNIARERGWKVDPKRAACATTSRTRSGRDGLIGRLGCQG